MSKNSMSAGEMIISILLFPKVNRFSFICWMFKMCAPFRNWLFCRIIAIGEHQHLFFIFFSFLVHVQHVTCYWGKFNLINPLGLNSVEQRNVEQFLEGEYRIWLKLFAHILWALHQSKCFINQLPWELLVGIIFCSCFVFFLSPLVGCHFYHKKSSRTLVLLIKFNLIQELVENNN